MARPTRKNPKDLVEGPFLTGRPMTPAAASMQAVALRLDEQTKQTSAREIERRTGVNYVSVMATIRGEQWLDTYSLGLLEEHLGALWYIPDGRRIAARAAWFKEAFIAINNEAALTIKEIDRLGYGDSSVDVDMDLMEMRVASTVGANPLTEKMPHDSFEKLTMLWSESRQRAYIGMQPVYSSNGDPLWDRFDTTIGLCRRLSEQKQDRNGNHLRTAIYTTRYPGDYWAKQSTYAGVPVIYPLPEAPDGFRIVSTLPEALMPSPSWEALRYPDLATGETRAQPADRPSRHRQIGKPALPHEFSPEVEAASTALIQPTTDWGLSGREFAAMLNLGEHEDDEQLPRLGRIREIAEILEYQLLPRAIQSYVRKPVPTLNHETIINAITDGAEIAVLTHLQNTFDIPDDHMPPVLRR